jgi:hypothetical protein
MLSRLRRSLVLATAVASLGSAQALDAQARAAEAAGEGLWCEVACAAGAIGCCLLAPEFCEFCDLGYEACVQLMCNAS